MPVKMFVDMVAMLEQKLLTLQEKLRLWKEHPLTFVLVLKEGPFVCYYDLPLDFDPILAAIHIATYLDLPLLPLARDVFVSFFAVAFLALIVVASAVAVAMNSVDYSHVVASAFAVVVDDLSHELPRE